MIPRLSTIAHPLYKLLRREEKFVWGHKQQQVLDAIKEALTSGRVLAWPREKDQAKCPHLLEIDASPYGLGCLCKQADCNRIERGIAYQGRSLTKHKQNLSQVMLETMGLVYGIQSFDQKLGHATHPFIIRSDNFKQSLKYVLN
jgi:RNase H-like domain found in reverse transcriptase